VSVTTTMGMVVLFDFQEGHLLDEKGAFVVGVSVTMMASVFLGQFLQESFQCATFVRVSTASSEFLQETLFQSSTFRTFVLSMSSGVASFVFQQFLQEFLQQSLLATFAQASTTMSGLLDDLDDRLSDQGLRFDDLIALSE